jgi:hypothetical protein
VGSDPHTNSSAFSTTIFSERSFRLRDVVQQIEVSVAATSELRAAHDLIAKHHYQRGMARGRVLVARIPVHIQEGMRPDVPRELATNIIGAL